MSDPGQTDVALDVVAVDVVVLGGGSAGERVAARLAADGLRVAVVERRLVGGECPYFACIPSKAMLISAATRHTVTLAEEVGATDAPLDPGSAQDAFAEAVRRRDRAASHHDDSDHAKDLVDAGVLLVRGEGRISGRGTVVVAGEDGGEDGGQSLAYDHLILATGSAPVIPDLPGLRDAEPWTYEEAWTTRTRPDTLIVMGGGAVGCEIAQAFARFGTDVTLVETERVGAGLEPELAGDLAEVLRRDGVEVIEGVGLDAARRHDDGRISVTIDADERVVDQLVVAAGMAPRLRDLGLESLGLDPDELSVDAHGRVRGDPQVWAIGDVVGIAPFTHTANHQADIVAANIGGADRRVDYRAIPRAIYTSPAVAATGMTRAQAEEAGIDVASAAVDLAETARGWVDEAWAGHLVLVADRRTRLLVGASLIAPSAGETINEFSLAIRAGVDLEVLADLVHPFPTWSEGFGPAIAQLLEALGD